MTFELAFKKRNQLTVRSSASSIIFMTAPDDEATGRGYNCRCRSPDFMVFG